MAGKRKDGPEMKRILAFCLVLLFLTSCAAAPSASGESQTRPASLPATRPAGETTTAATETTRPPETETTQPETTLSPAAVQGYTYDPYLLPQETIEFFPEGFSDFYRQVVDAYLKGETHVTAPDDTSAELISLVLHIEFPMFDHDAYYEFFENYDRETKEMTIVYSTTPEEHQAWIRRFTEAANEFLAEVSSKDNEVLRAEELYHALCTRMTYDYEGMETRVNVEPWNAIVDHSGVCYSFAGALRVLLTQIGVTAYSCSGESGPDRDAHVWLLAELDGKNYFLDPTFELGWNNGSAFVYFGETLEERFADGICEDWISIGSYDIRDYRDVEISEDHLQIQSLPG